MKLGFAVYFLAVALAPLTCYGVWVHVSLWAESLTYSQALALLDDEGRARGSVLHLPVGPGKNFLSVLHHLDLCSYEA